MKPQTYNPALHRLALLTTAATFPLIFMGGLVTSHGAGMSVPDWPNSYGYNMFTFPPSGPPARDVEMNRLFPREGVIGWSIVLYVYEGIMRLVLMP